jgi:hypothetical protein
MRNEIIYEFPIDLDKKIVYDRWGDEILEFKQDV